MVIKHIKMFIERFGGGPTLLLTVFLSAAGLLAFSGGQCVEVAVLLFFVGLWVIVELRRK